MLTRIYLVTGSDGDRLVDATSPAQAIRHVVRLKYASRVATPKEIAAMMSAGHIVETAVEGHTAPVTTNTHTTTHTN